MFKVKLFFSFLEWYNKKKVENYVFRMKEELLTYFDILRNGCVRLGKLFQKIANVNLFQYFSIVFTCMRIFKTHSVLNLIASIYSLTIIDSIRKDHVIKIFSF